MLVTLLKFILFSIQIFDIFVLAVCFKLINFVFQMLPFLGPGSNASLMLYFVLGSFDPVFGCLHSILRKI